jgi:hypothetical protein
MADKKDGITGINESELASSISDALGRRRKFLRLAAGAGAAVGIGGILAACGGGGDDGREAPLARPGSGGGGGTCAVLSECTATWDLIAGQKLKVGTVTVTKTRTDLVVTWDLFDNDAAINKIHVWAGYDLATLPKSGNGAPIPGQFPYAEDLGGADYATRTIPLSVFGLTIPLSDADCDKPLLVVIHAEVDVPKGADGASSPETAFAGPCSGDTGPRWYFYGQLVGCCTIGGPDDQKCDTAFAYGTHVLTNDLGANPDQLPTVGFKSNRWGWAIQLAAGTDWAGRIYAGAGKNDTSKGTDVGSFTATWNVDGSLTVSYTIDSAGCSMTEVHLQAATSMPTDVAPGKYNQNDAIQTGFSAGATTATATLTFPEGSTEVWLVAHAVVCCDCNC